ncbi:MAG: hypothetical protein ACOC53_01080 [Candidatus Saliniplasma sp.]
MVSSNKNMIMVLLASTLLLFSTIGTASVVGYDNGAQPPDYSEIVGNYEGGNINFEVVDGEEEIFTIEDFEVDVDGDNYQMFENIEIEFEGSWAPITSEEKGSRFRFDNDYFNLLLVDSEEGKLKVENKYGMERTIKVSIIIGRDVSLTDDMTLEVDDRLGIDFNLSGDVDYQIKRGPDGVSEYNFELKSEGVVESSIKEIIDETPPERVGNRPLPPISIGKDGTMEPPSFKSGLNVVSKNIKKGSVGLTVSGEFEESRIVRVSIDRNVIGKNISDMDDIIVEIDGEEVEHFEPWQDLYNTDEPGYYVNMTKSETEVFIRMDFSEHDIRVYERTTEDVLSPYSYLGLLVGAIVVIAGAGILFKKNGE